LKPVNSRITYRHEELVSLWRLQAVRIGFLFNHDQIHQVAHSLPIAVALSKCGIDAQIILASTSTKLAREVARMLGPARSASISLVDLALRSPASRLTGATLTRFVPASRLLVFRDNLDFFRSLDFLVVTERTSLILKTHYGLERPFMIQVSHGAGDRAIGYDKLAARFDHILAAGQKSVDRFINESGVQPERLSITGYAKFDIRPGAPPALTFPDNGKPTVVYNPHVSPHLSSWYREGRGVLDFFLGNPDYNLIFAPHIMLFQRRAVFTIDRLRLGLPGKIHPKYADAPNIHIDLESPALADMTYTNMADIYLGDVSSQVYEFLRTPKPCVFLNAHKVDYRSDSNYAHWQCGPVIDTAKALGSALNEAVSNHETRYRPIQQALFAYTFDLQDMPSAVRAAAAITRLAEEIYGEAPQAEQERSAIFEERQLRRA
jgi:hypothetical protein